MRRRQGVTLIELMIAVGILALLAAIAMSALANLEERAKIERTKTIIKRIDAVIADKWESYHTRPLPIRMPTNISQATAALIRLRAVRDLMRMEMPERASDIDSTAAKVDPVNLAAGLSDKAGTTLTPMTLSEPSPFRRYKRIVTAAGTGWATSNQQSECLYLILSGMRDAESSPLDFLAASEIGDTDGDGMKEILDGWGRPIYWWRWAPGYLRDFNPMPTDPFTTAWPNNDGSWDDADPDPNPDPRDVLTTQDRFTPDPFDPFKADPQWTATTPNVPAQFLRPFALRPLIVSAGPDKQIDLVFHFERTYADAANPPSNKNFQNNPFMPFAQASIPYEVFEGQPYDFDKDGRGWADNITNHDIGAP